MRKRLNQQRRALALSMEKLSEPLGDTDMKIEIDGPPELKTDYACEPVSCPRCWQPNANPFNPPPLFFKEAEDRASVTCVKCGYVIQVIRLVRIEYEVNYR